MKSAQDEYKKMGGGNVDDIDWNNVKPFMELISKDILAQKKHMGGNFAVALAVTSQDMRDLIRSIIPDCIFITLTLTEETQAKRVKERHEDGPETEAISEVLTKMYKLYEGPGEGEKNTYNVDINMEMSPKDVLDKVLEVLEKNCESSPGEDSGQTDNAVTDIYTNSS